MKLMGHSSGVRSPSELASRGGQTMCRITVPLTVLTVLLLALVAGQAGAQPSIPAPGFQPSGLAFDGVSLFVAELSGFRTIFEVDPTDGSIINSFLAPSPTGLNGNGNTNGLAYDGAGHLFVSDIDGVVYEIDTAGTTIFNEFVLPFRGGAIAFDGTNLYIGDFDSGQVRVTDRCGNFVRTLALFDTFQMSFVRPAGLTFEPVAGHLWSIDIFDTIIAEFTLNGVGVRSCEGPHDPGIQGLGGVTWVGSLLYVAEVSDPDPFNPPNIPGTIFLVDPESLSCSVADSDGDGVPDEDDACPDSDLSPTVIIDGCDSGVDNVLDANGCTISDLIAECADGASNHGQFVSCGAQLTNGLENDGVITGQERGAIQGCAAQADLP